MAHQQEERLLRRLLENLEQRVGGAGIEFIDGIDDADPPALDGRGRAEKRDRLAGFVNRDDGPHHALVVEAAFKREQAAMGARRDMARDRIGWIHPQRLGVLHIRCQGIAMGEHEPRHPIGQRRLADARRPADQPGMRNAAAAVGVQQGRLGVAMPEQCRGFARMDDGNLRLDLTGAHAGLATVSTLAAKNRSRSAAHTLAATAPASALASIKTHRCGSSAAICRKASRNS
jgi:hypothetical protein